MLVWLIVPLLSLAAVDTTVLAQAIADLKDDDTSDNATFAISRLTFDTPDPVPALQQTLSSTDVQQRHLAAYILRLRDNAPVSPELIAVTIEALRSDVHPEATDPASLGAAMWARVTDDAVLWLHRHAHMAERGIRAALDSRDGRQRFLAAVICAHARLEGTSAQALRTMLPHLADNATQGDAVMAAVAIHRLGPKVLEDLRAWRHSGDAQTQALLAQIIRELEQPAARTMHREGVLTLNAPPLSVGLGEDALSDTPLSARSLQWPPAQNPPAGTR